MPLIGDQHIAVHWLLATHKGLVDTQDRKLLLQTELFVFVLNVAKEKIIFTQQGIKARADKKNKQAVKATPLGAINTCIAKIKYHQGAVGGNICALLL